MKKLLYIANLRLPTEKAYGIQIAKMCEAFALQTRGTTQIGTQIYADEEKLEVELVVPHRKNHIKDDFFDYYGIKRNFNFKKIWAPDFYLPGKLDRISVMIKDFISGTILAVYGLFSGADFIYSRDEWPLFFLSFFSPSPFFKKKCGIVYEVHRFSENRGFFYRRFINSGIKAVAITELLKEDLIKFGFKSENILIAPDGVNIDEFTINITKKEARARVGLPEDKTIVMYTGHLFEWKGASTLLETAKSITNYQLPITNSGVLFVFVGGMEYDVKKFKEKAGGLDNVLILGQKPHKEIPFYLKAADVLVLPNSAKEEISRSYTSPLKLFEYMASGRPIVASSLPSIAEVLNDKNSVLVKPDDADDLMRGIKKILDNDLLSRELSRKAKDDVANYTWVKRVEKIKNFIN